MDLQELNKVIEDIIKQAYDENRQRFGTKNPKTLSKRTGSLRNSIKVSSDSNTFYISMNYYGKYLKNFFGMAIDDIIKSKNLGTKISQQVINELMKNIK